jgi:FkbM family methyltransferase
MFGPLEPAYLSIAGSVTWRGEGRAHRWGTEVQVGVPNGLRMLVPTNSPSLPYFLTGLYEQDLTDLLLKQVEPGMNVVDVGANVGYYSLVASTLVGSSGRVYAFEPDPESFSYLTRNVDLNACRNVVPIRMAVSDRAGSASFVRRNQDTGFLSGDAGSASVNVSTVSLDEFFAEQGWPTVGLVKMDVEGSERVALLGMKELSRRNPSLRLIMEFNLDAMGRLEISTQMLTSTLKELGFREAYLIEKRLRSLSMKDSLPESRIVHDLLLVK